MANTRSTRKFSLVHMARKYFVSAFVVFSFAAYAVHERSNGADTGMALPTPTLAQTRQDSVEVPQSTLPVPTTGQADQQNNALSQPSQPTLEPSATATTQSAGMYKDGVYTGRSANAFFGIVQVKAVIQGGKITDVQFVNYPHDRRTSVYINSQAMPWLTQEAIQAQSAQVDIISGATLTSQAFIQSLQSALDSARA
jgi:uncharacterized protein with FMN-binding domain